MPQDKYSDRYLRCLVKEELERISTKKIIKDSFKKSDSFHKHPVFIALVSFILTGVLGAGISNHIKNINKNQTIKHQAFEHLNRFSEDFMRRRIEAGYMRYAFKRKVSKVSLIEKKKQYDDAVKQWRKNYLSHQFTFRKHFGATYSTYIETTMEKFLITSLFARIDDILTKVYDDAIENDIHFSKDTDILLGKLLIATGKCGAKFSNHIFDLVKRDVKFDDKQKWNIMKNDFIKSLPSECSIGE